MLVSQTNGEAMILKKLDAVTKADIDGLITNKVSESKSLEYKETLPGNTDRDRKEFLADVSSFGNASGGDILYGIRGAITDGNKTGEADAVIPIVGVTADQAKLKLEQMILDGIAPRLRVEIREIAGWDPDGAGYIIIARIAKSFASPHMVTLQNTSRFYSRNSAGKYQLDVGDIRSAFLATESQSDRVRRFIEDRLSRIAADETSVSLSARSRLVLHMIPLQEFLSNARLTLPDAGAASRAFSPIGFDAWDFRYNLDGVLSWTRDADGGAVSYCQLFFSGAIEAVYAEILVDSRIFRDSPGDPALASVAYEREIIHATRRYLQGLKQLGSTPPFVVSLALLNCRNARMNVSPRLARGQVHRIDRDFALTPNVVIEDFTASVPVVLKPAFDAIWNACGYPHSLNYDQDGNWVAHR
jgi:hypothetical protein